MHLRPSENIASTQYGLPLLSPAIRQDDDDRMSEQEAGVCLFCDDRR